MDEDETKKIRVMKFLKSPIILISMVILIILAMGFIFFAQPIKTALLKKIVCYKMSERNIHFDEGLHAILCGTGTPIADIERAGPCIAVIAGEHLYILDAGEGSARNIQVAGLRAGRIDAILLTHFHSDHIASLGDIMLLRWVVGSNSKPVDVIGPPGVERVVEGFNFAYKLDTDYRIAHHGIQTVPPTGAGGVARPFTLSSEGNASTLVVNRDGVKITAFKVDHRPVVPAVGYRFDYKGRSLVISGDTVYSESLLAHAKGVDLLIHEALQPSLVKLIKEFSWLSPSPSLGRIMEDIPKYHASPEDVAKIAQKAGVSHLVLYHIIPPLPSSFILKKMFLGQAKDYYDGPITMGVDGMLVSMPAESKEIKIKKLFK